MENGADPGSRRRSLTVVVPKHAEGRRLDELLGMLIGELSRRAAARLCTAGQVRVDGRCAPKGCRPAKGSLLEVALEPLSVLGEPEAALNVVLVTRDIVVVDKPPLQPSTVRHRDDRGTLINALIGRYPELASVGERASDPALIHRLDNGTSGLLLAARNDAAYAGLSRALRELSLEKTYHLLVDGENLPDRGTIALEIGQHPKDPTRALVVCPEHTPLDPSRRRFMTNRASSQCFPARTDYEVQTRTQRNLALVRVRLKKARRHQIRVHFAAIGHPLVNDVLYGAPPTPVLPPGRHALHASGLRFPGNEELPGFDVTVPLCQDLALLLAELD